MEIVLHLGAHKTASTYIQQVLAENASVLASHNVGMVLPREFRERTKICGHSDQWLRKLHLRQKSRSLLKELVDEASIAGKGRLVISEENLLGTLDRLSLGAGFYDQARGTLRAALSGLEDHPVTVLIATRSFADYFASAWAQAIRNGPFVPFDAGLKTRLMNLSASWADLIEDLADILPRGSKLVAWQYEHMPDIENRIFELLVGQDCARRMIPLDIKPMAGPSHQAIDTLTQMNAEGTSPCPDMIEDTLRFFRKSKGLRAFDPWTPSERALLNSRYKNDLALLAKRRPDALLSRPVGSGLALDLQSGVNMYPEPRTVCR